MIIERANYVEGARIDDAWRDAMWLCVKKGYDYIVERGSYEGQIRRQLPNITIKITEPGKLPLGPIMPPNIPAPTTDESIARYFHNSLMNPEIAPNQQYTYGSFIVPQLPRIIEMLVEAKGNTNQATISIGDRGSVYLADPPCLRVINFKVADGRLSMSVVFRSWDLIAGLPENLGGLQLLKEYVGAYLPFKDGDLIAFSDGLHIYEQYFEIANMLNVDKIEVSEDTKRQKEKFAKKVSEK